MNQSITKQKFTIVYYLTKIFGIAFIRKAHAIFLSKNNINIMIVKTININILMLISEEIPFLIFQFFLIFSNFKDVYLHKEGRDNFEVLGVYIDAFGRFFMTVAFF